MWAKQCAAAEGLLRRFGYGTALSYIVGEKFWKLVRAAECCPALASEAALFAAEIVQLFTSDELRDYLDFIESTARAESWTGYPDARAKDLITCRRMRLLLLSSSQ
jgi:hypothetical protein